MAPGSQVVTNYYEKAGLWPYLEKLGYHLVGYGCTTCIGNSGPLPEEVSKVVIDNDLAVVSVLSGNRNFEGQISSDVKTNYLASPPLVIAYALAGTMDFDFDTEPLGTSEDGTEVYLKDIWPSPQEVQETITSSIHREMFTSDYADVFAGDEHWRSLDTPEGDTFAWDPESTYVRKPPYFEGMGVQPEPVADIAGARVLAKLGDSVTTDHSSPARARAASPSRWRTSLAPGCWPSSATRSPPTTSPRRARSSRTPRRASTSRSTAWRARTSTPTAPGAGTTR